MIKKTLLKAATILLALIFSLITAADMYLKTLGDISDTPAPQHVIKTAEALTHFRKKNGALRIISYNLLADTIGFDGENAQLRADGVCKIFKSLSPDALCLQEVSRSWFACIMNNTRYRFVHPIRTGLFATMTAIAYNPEALHLIKSGEQVFEHGVNSSLRRAVWAMFEIKNENVFFILVSTHFDLNQTVSSPLKNATQLLQATEVVKLCLELNAREKCPVILGGDFNAKKATKKNPSPVYDIINGFFPSAEASAHSRSYLTTEKSGNPLDHIFHTDTLKVEKYYNFYHRSLEELSDHYPIMADFSFTKQ